MYEHFKNLYQDYGRQTNNMLYKYSWFNQYADIIHPDPENWLKTQYYRSKYLSILMSLKIAGRIKSDLKKKKGPWEK